MAVVSSVVIVSFIFLIGFFVGIHNYLKNYEGNKCDMTFMFEYPQYVRISLPPNVTFRYKRYGLFAYSEGHFTEKTREMKFSGIPVLFIPGNSGSLKQVRSLASVSLRKALSSHSSYHFNFFSVDLNEEYMGLFGGFLTEQTRFVLHSIQRIFQLYKYNPPDSIVIIGHSMGGVIAKGLFLEPDFNPDWVKLMYTLATPYTPALLLDNMMANYYERLTLLPPLTSATLVSVGGGVRDLLIRSDLIYTPDAAVSVLTTQIPDVWLSTDHLSITWCKQLILVITRSLFDCVDPVTKKISDDNVHREAVVNYHFLNRSAGKCYGTSHHTSQVILWDHKSPPGEWFETLRTQYTMFYPTGSSESVHIMIRLTDLPQREVLHVLLVNHRNKDWLFACRASAVYKESRLCSTGDNLSGYGRIAPTKVYKRKTAELNLIDLYKAGYTHVIVRLLPTNQPLKLHFDIHDTKERLIVPTSLPNFFSPMQTTLIQRSTPGAIFYRINLPGLEAVWQAYRLWVYTANCSQTNQTHHEVVIKFVVPWKNEGASKIVSSTGDFMQIRLQSSKPSDSSYSDPYIDLTLDPVCSYNIRMEKSVIDTLGQLARFYSPLLLASVATVLLLTLRHQLQCLASAQNSCPLVMTAVIQGARPYYILPAVKILTFIMAGKIQLFGFFPVPDWIILQDPGLDFAFLPILLYMVGFALVYVFAVFAYFSVVISGQTVNKLVLRFLGRFVPSWSDWLLAGVGKMPVIVAVFMLGLCYSASGGLALAVGCVFYFLKVCSLYEDYLEQLMLHPYKVVKRRFITLCRDKLFKKTSSLPQIQNYDDDDDDDGDNVVSATESTDTNTSSDVVKEQFEVIKDITQDIKDIPADLLDLTEINYHVTLLLLWFAATSIHVPSILVWARNYRYNSKLEPDPAIHSAVILSVCAAVLWQGEHPKTDLAYYDELSTVMFILACCTLLFAPISLYRLSPLLTSAFVILTLHHLLTPWLTKSTSPPTSPTSQLEIEESQSQPTEITDSSTPDEIEFKAIAETLGSISERTEEITDDQSQTTSSNQSESDKDLELIMNSKSDHGKITPSTDSEPELSSSNVSVSSFENLSTTELLPQKNNDENDDDNDDNGNDGNNKLEQKDKTDNDDNKNDNDDDDVDHNSKKQQ
ncbi:GPI inositol-deacylase isoform X2 [Lycorma delicatula]|uniref:GPI inositol-deacylase isoform X2 n=1 Tax=Lycorma delicatula TaxID=130591 RepID=UPI003F5155F9